MTPIKTKLEQHLHEKIDNHLWISDCLNNAPNAFPYQLAQKTAQVTQHQEITGSYHRSFPSLFKSKAPRYLVNTPLFYSWEQHDWTALSKLIQLFKNESFGRSDFESSLNIHHRLALVIGVNRPRSIDPERNRTFQKAFQALPSIPTIAYRTFGFFWEPAWKQTHDNAPTTIYPRQKAFLLLKALSASAAQVVLRELEGERTLSDSLRGQIPFQGIREKIKNSQASQAFAQYFQQHASQSPIYFAVMDADCKALRIKTGIFSRFTKLILAQNYPSALTLGYSIQDQAQPIIQLGIRLDMCVRAAMSSVIPYSAYMPEPGTIFRLRNLGETHSVTERLAAFSFIGAGQTLENRRLIQNGLTDNLFDKQMIFHADGGVVTTVPARMKTGKNQELQGIDPAALAQKIKTKAVLQMLRNISQSHIHPKEWADNVYIALRVRVSLVTDITGPMMRIFGLFDPIARMYNLGEIQGRYTSACFDTVLSTYDEPLSLEAEKTLAVQGTILFNHGITIPMIEQIVEAAHKSGQAIQHCLLDHSV